MAKKVLFINQEITPFVPETNMSIMGKELPQKAQEAGLEIRTFMPKWGNINERRGQLHEVIRLSGMNLIIDDTDHPLIIKVASIPQSRIQVYFIDNDDYFTKRQMTIDEEGNEYNYVEEMVFDAGSDKYAILVSIDGDEECECHEHDEQCGCEEEVDVILAKIVKDENGEVEYIEPTDEEFEIAQQAYEELMDKLEAEE